MLYGIREICDVVLRAKGYQKIGNMVFHKDMPVLYFDSLKTSSLEGAATTVYATGGRGNTRLIAWEGEKTITFTMEDALISPISLSVLSGAGIIDKSDGGDMAKIKHATERVEVVTQEEKQLLGLKGGKPYTDTVKGFYGYIIPLDHHGDLSGQPVRVDKFEEQQEKKLDGFEATVDITDLMAETIQDTEVGQKLLKGTGFVMVDYYYEAAETVMTQIDIDAQHFAGNYYLEASTLWRNKDGEDVSAEFIIPNCKIQSNFTFSMASTGDPSTFTFTMDAFPDFTKYDKTNKVLCALRIDETSSSTEDKFTGATAKLNTGAAAAAYRGWKSEVASTRTED